MRRFSHFLIPGLCLPMAASGSEHELSISNWKKGTVTLERGGISTTIDLRQKISGCLAVARWYSDNPSDASNFVLLDSHVTSNRVFVVLAAGAWSDCKRVNLNLANTDWTLFWLSLDKDLKLIEEQHVVVASSFQGDRTLASEESWKATPFAMIGGVLRVEFFEGFRGTSPDVTLYVLSYDSKAPASGFALTSKMQPRRPVAGNGETPTASAIEKTIPPQLRGFTESDVAQMRAHPLLKDHRASRAGKPLMECDGFSVEDPPSTGTLPKLAQRFGLNWSLCGIVSASSLLRPSRSSFLPPKLTRDFIRLIPAQFPLILFTDSFSDNARGYLSVATGHSLLDDTPALAFESGSETEVSYEDPRDNRSYFTAEEIMRGDVNGDGIEDWVFEIRYGGGGTQGSHGLAFFTRRTADGILEYLDMSPPNFGRVSVSMEVASRLSYAERREAWEKAVIALGERNECSPSHVDRVKKAIGDFRKKKAYDIAGVTGATYLSWSSCEKTPAHLEANLWMWSDALLDAWKSRDYRYCIRMASEARENGYLAKKFKNSKAYAAFSFNREKCRTALCSEDEAWFCKPETDE